jgi:HTH-type transcriptional regulator / antitoxin HigA
MTRRIGKMTLTFNETHYSNLLSRHQPKLIKTEAENDRALSVVEELMHRSNLTPEEDELLNLLVVLIERFEVAFYQCGAESTPHSMLVFLMEQQALSPTHLLPIFKSESEVQAILEGSQDLTIAQVKALANRFQVNPGVFI